MPGAVGSGQAVLVHEVEGISHSERPVRFRAGDDEIFGILTEPHGTPRGVGVVLLSAASDRNRFIIRLARRAAGLGFHALRLDYHGFGESSGRLTGTSLKHAIITLGTSEEPFTQDLLGAVAELGRRGIGKIVVIGRCFGARTALSGVKRIRDLGGMAWIALPLHRSGGADQQNRRGTLEEVRAAARRGVRLGVLRALLNPRRRASWMRKLRIAAGQMLRSVTPGKESGGTAAEWVSEAVMESLREAVSRGVPLLFVYGTEPVYRDFLQAQAGPLGPILAAAGDRVRVSLVDGPANNLTNLAVQEAVLTCTLEWLDAHF